MLIERGKDPDAELARIVLDDVAYSVYEIDCRMGQEIIRSTRGRGDIEVLFIKRLRSTGATSLVKIPQIFDDANEGRKIANSIRMRRVYRSSPRAKRTGA